jgi:hypothetical protein
MAAFFGFFHSFLLNFLNLFYTMGSSLVLRVSFARVLLATSVRPQAWQKAAMRMSMSSGGGGPGLLVKKSLTRPKIYERMEA